MSNIKDCFTCTNQLKKKQKSSVICTGCQKPFCKLHHQEHRKLIENDFNGLIEQHNTLRQNLYNENDNSRTSKLLKMIDDWEKETITNIKATAAAKKTRLTQIINEEKDQLKNKFKVMTDELKTNQPSSDYVEPDIQEWQKQISECKQKLEQLQAYNNDFINMDIKPIDWSNSINIYKRKDVLLKTNIAALTRLVPSRRERSISCLCCDKSFYANTDYSGKFCSQDCETNYDIHNPDNSSSDEDNACFHGNCVVSLANG
jgi:DNA repair exonuclease SbcCD ATPase subunit